VTTWKNEKHMGGLHEEACSINNVELDRDCVQRRTLLLRLLALLIIGVLLPKNWFDIYSLILGHIVYI